MSRRCIKNGSHLLPVDRVEFADYSRIEELVLVVHHSGGTETTLTGIDAIEAVMLLNPSCLEGRRLRWVKGAWHLHNLVGHPLTSMLAMAGLYKWAFWMHDKTVPKPVGRRT